VPCARGGEPPPPLVALDEDVNELKGRNLLAFASPTVNPIAFPFGRRIAEKVEEKSAHACARDDGNLKGIVDCFFLHCSF